MRKVNINPTVRRLFAASPLFLAACGTLQQNVDSQYMANRDAVTDYSNKVLTQTTTSNVPLVQKSSGAWLGGKALPLQADLTLPEVFRKRYAFKFPGKVGIETVAQRVTQVTGIPVRVKPDVLLPTTAFVTGGNAIAQTARQTAPTTTASSGSVLPPLPAPQTMGNQSSLLATGLSASGAFNPGLAEYEMNYEGPVSGFLDLLSARAGISWEYREGVISLHRLVTKIFTLKAIPGDSTFKSAIGKQGQTQAGAVGSTNSQSSAGYNSQTNIEMNSKFSLWESVEDAIKSVISPAGKYAISQASGTITVTDTRDVVDQVAKIVDHENAANTRQIAMRVEVLSVKLNNGQEFGVDWDLVFNQVSNLVPWSLRFSSPASLVSNNAANLGVSILAPTNGAMSASQARWGGSKAFFKALSSFGRVSVVTTANAMTLNRQPVPVAITNQTTYLAKVTPAPAGASGSAGGTPGLEPGTVTTGFLLNLLPTVLDSNSILLQFGLGISDLTALVDVPSGDQKIQAPEISSTDFLQKVAIRPGETLVLSGYERSAGQYDKRTLTSGAPIGLGGSINGTSNREAVVILVTPVLSEGAI
ncbi:Type IVB pilus formation outer membrane protein,PilN family [Cupriavidus taiwanensis]|nr:Type IVB pilus formation outer membrane protein,PilN family [Cupriavidus taiwanensis]